MVRIDTARTDAAKPRAMNDTGPAAGLPDAAPAADAPDLAAFRAGRSEAERTADLLAFAIATERGLAPTPEAVERARREADAALGDYSLRYLHNAVEQIRQEAVAAHLSQLRPPPGFPKLVAANLVALAIAAAASAALYARPEIRAALAGLLGN